MEFCCVLLSLLTKITYILKGYFIGKRDQKGPEENG